MNANMKTIDRIIRVLIAIVVTGLYYREIIMGTFGIVLLVLAGVFLFTSLLKFCPIYAILGISTNPHDNIDTT